MKERLASETIVDGRYRVLRRIGSGGMADVYCAEDLQLGRQIALKVLHGRFAEDDEFVERFRREARSAAGLQHQHVVSVYDRGEWDGTYYIAMEFLAGRSLKAIIQEEAPLDPERAIDLTVQVLRAARFAHRRGVIHRDLKPHNVIVDEEGRAKVTDFGIARAGASDMTQTGSIMGTAQYLSPEQAQGHAVSAPSDLYSVGIILYELLTGRVPFEGESAVTIALKQVNERPVPPSMFNRAVTPALEAVVMRALEKDPGRRFPDADAFIAALEHARAELPAGVVAAPVAAPTVVETTPLYDPYVEQPPPEELYEEEAASRRWWLWLVGLLLVAAAAAAGFFLLNRASGPPQVTVPNVVGADQAAAEARLTREGFVTRAVSRTSEERPKGEVLGTDPAPGEQADKGSTVRLTVSDGPGTASVPSVEGLTRRSARARLRRAGFEIEERRESSDTVPDGRAIRTSPPDGSTLEKGRTVTLLLSTGKEQVEVPDVTGQTFEEASSALENRGFQVARNDQVTDDEDPGTVLKQSPGGGQRIDKGSTITLAVAKEPQEAEVTDVTGETQRDAVQTLSQDGFEIDIQEQPVESQEGDGVVIEQDPAGGRARRGSTVTLVVGRFDPAAQPQTPPPTTSTPTTPPPTP
ncbi:MAG TPA: Stk1 family PASTA domain-containing Ser/Thr kinase [Solirubrobacteraceae bacterium]|nr:Stk1 family PASTA domain-containing Ser/Thr kinase [Solirubrobacteraceae bacterium]